MFTIVARSRAGRPPAPRPEREANVAIGTGTRRSGKRALIGAAVGADTIPDISRQEQ
jgi:hypothetical protein